jgi:AcrR family transcriptional regulator
LYSRARKFGTQQERTDLARKKLLEAAIALTAENGLGGFSLAEVERRAGLNRGLAAYHFQGLAGLQHAVAAELLVEEPATVELGLRPFLAWLEKKLTFSAADKPMVIALANVTRNDPSAPFAQERKRYWKALSAHISAHLARGQVLREVRQDLDVTEAALILAGQLQAERLRVVTTTRRASPLFVDMVERAIAAPKAGQRPSAKSSGSKPEPRQQGLFGDG